MKIRRSHDELAPSATGSFDTPGSTSLAIPPNTAFPLDANGNPISPPNTPTSAETGVPADAFNPFNPFQQIISGGTRARLLEFGNRLFDNETNNFLSTVGIRGDKLLDGTWGYDFGFRYSNVQAIAEGTLVSASRFDRVLNQNDPIFQPGGILAGQPLSTRSVMPCVALRSRVTPRSSTLPRCIRKMSIRPRSGLWT